MSLFHGASRAVFLSVILSLLWSAPTLAASAMHAFSLHGEPKHPAGFSHFDYVNPSAPKGGRIVLAALGTYDNLNPYILKGTSAAGIGLLFDTLMMSSSNEASTEYGLIAETITLAPNNSAATFTLRPEARFHDGTPVMAEDVVFTLNTLKEEGHPFYRAYYRDVTEVRALDDHTVRFQFADGNNRELPLIIGQMPVLSKAYYGTRPFNQTTLTAPIGSGPYKVNDLDPGRSITYVRDPNYWARDLNVNVGRHNFDEIRYDYYRDASVILEALKTGNIDLREENVAKNWASAYDFPAIRDGRVIKEKIPHQRPTGMQGFAYNTRRTLFSDPLVREALSYAFDFEWANRTLFNDAYTRTESFFSNSELASQGLPSQGELALLTPFKDQLDPRVFSQAYVPPTTDGSGNARQNLRQAKALLEQAGWTLEDGILQNSDGVPFEFEILIVNPAFERITLPFADNLKRLGITANVRLVDATQYQKRLESFDYDMTVVVIPQSPSPGNEQIDFWHSEKANLPGSRNYMGVSHPAVDATIQQIINAQTREDLISASRALDRMLLWNFYVIPQWHIRSYRIAYWDRFGRPDLSPKYALGFIDTWWVDTKKDAALEKPRGASEADTTPQQTTQPKSSSSLWIWIIGGLLVILTLWRWRRQKK